MIRGYGVYLRVHFTLAVFTRLSQILINAVQFYDNADRHDIRPWPKVQKCLI